MAGVDGIINRLAGLIEKPVKQEFHLLVNSKAEAQKLSSSLKEIQKVLEEAEKRRSTDPRVKSWLQRLENLTYQVDDALDEWETVKFQIQNQEFDDEDDDDGEKDAFRTCLNKVSIFIESVCLCFQRVHRHRDIALNIKGLNEKVDLLAKETPKYSILLPISSDSPEVKPKITTSFSQLVRLEDQHNQKDRIVNELLTCQDLVDDIHVISLVGMPGIGKTTLAQLAFHDPRVESSFELRSWICLSHTSNEVHVAKAILHSLHVNYPEHADLQTLLELIQAFVSRKKFLVVLDNVWIEDDSFWRQLKGPLIYGNTLGIRILATSRNQNVAKSMGSTKVIQVQCLSYYCCRVLFNEIALRGRDKYEGELLDNIAHRIVLKCEGLPLAVKTLGCYLQSIDSKQIWEDVMLKELWQLEEVAHTLFAPFILSYNELPLAAKHCFSYCGHFSNYYRLNVTDLIRLWMMQGYLISSNGTDDGDMELKGMGYFEKLAARYFFRVSKDNDMELKGKRCDMEKIVYSFTRYLIKTVGSKVEEIRSFGTYDNETLPANLGSLKSVRVLKVRRQLLIDELPLGIGKLIHLRYLGVNDDPTINKLPATICNLYNLHTLDLRCCGQLSELPEQIHKMRNLKHLLLFKTRNLKRVPQGVGKLTALRIFDEFKVGRERSKLRYLADLNQLRGSMYIYMGDLNEEEDVEDAEKAQLSKKIYIRYLTLEIDGEVGMDVMEALQVPRNLEYLRLSGYKNTEFPSWINGSYLNNLTSLVLNECNCLELPPLGTLGELVELYVIGMYNLKCLRFEFVWEEGLGLPFQKLRKLVFRQCLSWEEWEDISTGYRIPGLQTVRIINCPKLKALPRFLRRDPKISIKAPHHLLQQLYQDMEAQN